MTDPIPARITIRELGPASLLAVAWAVVPALLGVVVLVHLGTVATWLEGPGVFVFALIFAVTSGLGLLPTYAQAVVGGWVFGAVLGIVGSLFGFVGGALVGWAVARLVARNRVGRIIDRHPHAAVIRSALIGRGMWRTTGVVAMLRLPPNSPFALTNLAMAACGVPLLPYVMGTAAGMLPRTAIFVSAAAAASGGGEDLQEFITQGPGTMILIIGIVLLVAVLAILAAIGKRAVAQLASN